jgi:hypothetical protein
MTEKRPPNSAVPLLSEWGFWRIPRLAKLRWRAWYRQPDLRLTESLWLSLSSVAGFGRTKPAAGTIPRAKSDRLASARPLAPPGAGPALATPNAMGLSFDPVRLCPRARLDRRRRRTASGTASARRVGAGTDSGHIRRYARRAGFESAGSRRTRSGLVRSLGGPGRVWPNYARSLGARPADARATIARPSCTRPANTRPSRPRPSRARAGIARLGHACLGAARPGVVRFGTDRLFVARVGVARLGSARSCDSWHEVARSLGAAATVPHGGDPRGRVTGG